MKICILTIATNKYIQFVEELYNNIEKHFLNGHDIEGIIFTEHEVEVSDNIKVSKIEHEPWPMPTLKRYNYFMKEAEHISKYDYCFYFDVDMGLVAKVGDEVLSDLVATMHPYQSFSPKEQRTYDRNPKSLAYVSPGNEGEHYYAGGFNGGSTKEFLKMSEVIANRVTKELEHDELKKIINNKTKILAVTHCSNIVGSINNLKLISDIAHQYGTIVIGDAFENKLPP